MIINLRAIHERFKHLCFKILIYYHTFTFYNLELEMLFK